MALVEEVAAVGGAGGGGGSGGGRACGPEDPEALLNEWLGELTILTAGLQNAPNSPVNTLRPLEIAAPRIDTYGFSMANMEETQDADLDAILGELCALDSEYDEELSRLSAGYSPNYKHVKENGGSSEGAGQNRRAAELCAGAPPAGAIPRTHSPDNDSAFSDTVSMLSGESSASSAASAKCKVLKLNLHQEQKDPSFQQKADKIKLALERMREANVKKLFIKAFSTDGSSKSLLVDEKMNCGYVTRLLADKNHVTMEPRWALVEQLPDLHMERVYEDHEHLVDNLMLWTRESKNKILFAERPEKIVLFQTPEKFLLPEDDRGHWSEQDEHSRLVIIEEFFGSSGGASVPPSVSGHPVPSVEGPLYLKSDAKKGWKKYHFVLRPSGLYYFPKEKVKTLKELVCLATFDNNEVYLGISWRKKYKSPTDFCFAIKHPRLQQPKSVKFIKFLCADDQQSLERWMVAMRIAKHGRRLLENHRSLVEELAQDDLDHLAHARSCSISSIPTKSIGSSELQTNSPASQVTSSAASVAHSDISSGRHSRASSSSSSGCQSDGGTASESTFDCEFPMGTIKRKPSMKPNIPLTWMTRQLKEMAEKVAGMEDDEAEGSGECGTLTRRPRRAHQVQRTPSLTRSDDGGGTLKRQCRNNHNDPVESIYNSSIGSTATDQGPGSPSFSHYDIVLRDNRYRSTSDNGSTLYGFVGMFDSPTDTTNHIEELPLPPLPNELEVSENCAMFSSTLSLDSLPPPPPPPEPVLEDLCGSQLSLPPPPPLHTLEATSGRLHDIVNQLAAQQVASAPSALRARPFRSVTVPRQPSLDSMSSGGSDNPSLAYGACLLELQSKKLTGSPAAQIKHDREERKLERGGSIKKVAFAEDIECRSESFKNNKKILFASNGESNDCRPCSPRKPPPPRRNDSTRLSSPKKLADSESNPPTEFLEDLQRVMRKKWQVAQKCKSDVTTTPHEVLGFREYPLHTDYKEASVSMWVQEHYGGGGEQGGARRARPPPPAPPRRSDSTHLTRTGTPLHQAT